MPEGLGLLSGIGDIRSSLTRPEELTEDEKGIRQKMAELEIEDPFMQAIIHSPGLSPQTRAYLRTKEEQRVKREKLELELARLKANQETPGIVSWIGPVPVGLQVGSWLGMKPGVFQFLTDVVVDPVNLIGGVGTLTKLGRAGRLLKGLNAAEKAETIISGGRILGEMLGDPKVANEIFEAAKSYNAADLIKTFKKYGRKSLSEETLGRLAATEGIDPDFVNFMRNERRSFSDLRSAFDQEFRGQALDLATSRVEQLRTGQRSLVRLGVPGGGEYADITLGSFFKEFRPQRLADEVGYETAKRAVSQIEDLQPLGELGLEKLGGRPAGMIKKIAAGGESALDDGIQYAKEFEAGGKVLDEAAEGLKLSREDVFKSVGEATGKSASEIESAMGAAARAVPGAPKRSMAQNLLKAFTTLPEKGPIAKIFGGKGLKEISEFFRTPTGKASIQRVVSIQEAEKAIAEAGKLRKVTQPAVQELGEFFQDIKRIVATQDDISRLANRLRENKAATENALTAIENNPLANLKGFRDWALYGRKKEELEKYLSKAFKTPIQLKEETLKMGKKLLDLARDRDRFVTAYLRKKLGFSEESIRRLFHDLPSPGELEARLGKALAEKAQALLKKFKFKPQVAVKEILETTETLGKGGPGGLKAALDLAETASTKLEAGNVTRFSADIGKTLAGPGASEINALADGVNQYLRVIKGDAALAQFGSKNLIESPKPYLTTVQGEVDSVNNWSMLIGKWIRVITGNNEEILKKFPKAMEREKEYLSGLMKAEKETFDEKLKRLKELHPDWELRRRGISGEDLEILEEEYHWGPKRWQKLVSIDELLNPPKAQPKPGGFSDLLQTDAVRTMMDVLRGGLDQIGQVLIERELIAGTLEDYIPHITRRIDKTFDYQGLSEFVRRKVAVRGAPGFKHGLPRVFSYLEDTEEYIAKHAKGKLELVTRGDQIFEQYFRSAGRAIVRKNRLEELGRLAIPGEEGRTVIMKVPFGGEVPTGYVRIANPILKDLTVHPQYEKAIRSIFDANIVSDPLHMNPDLESKFWSFVRYTSYLGKSAIFRLGLVHFNSEFQAALGGIPLSATKQLMRSTGQFATNLRNPEKQALLTFQKIFSESPGLGGQVADASEEMTRFFMSNSKLNKADLSGQDLFKDLLNSLAQRAPFLKHPITGLQHLIDLVDVNLWDYKQNAYKAIYWVHRKAQELYKNPALLKDPEKLAAVEYEIANAGNTIFGGLGWERMLVTPRMRNFLDVALIAKDWTISNIKVAYDMMLNIPGLRQAIGGIPLAGGRLQRGFDMIYHALQPDVMLGDLRFKLALQYNVKASVYAFMFGNLLNYGFTGRWLWDNDKDSIDTASGMPRVELPYRRWDGKKQYMDVVNQLTEPLELFRAAIYGGGVPSDFLIPKLGTIPRLVTSELLGYYPSYDRPVYGQKDGPFDRFLKNAWNVASPFVPISFQIAKQAASGTRDTRSALISSLGFQTQTETPEAYRARMRRDEIEAQLQLMTR